MANDEELQAIAALIAEADRETAAALRVIFGPVPAWVPKPIFADRQRIACQLLADGADPGAIRRRIADTLAGKDMSELASPPLPYVIAVDTLADFLYAVSLGKHDGLRELAGPVASVLGGRCLGSFGTIRKEVDRLLEMHPDMKNPDLWKEIRQNPPEGWDEYEEGDEVYLLSKDHKELRYRSFVKHCSNSRKNAVKR